MKINLYEMLGDSIYGILQKGATYAIVIFAITLLIAIALFFIIRAIVCWYFKINQAIKQLKEVNHNLSRIAAALENANGTNNQALSVSNENTNILTRAIKEAAGQVATAVNHMTADTKTVVEKNTVAQEPVNAADATKAEATTEETPVAVTEAVPTPAPAPTPTIRKCPTCGSPMSDDAVFCVNCGTKVM